MSFIISGNTHGTIDAESILAWLPLEGKLYIERNIWWDPEYHFIADFYECFRVFAKDGDASLVFEYTGGEEKMIFHIKSELVKCLTSGRYEELPQMGDFD